MLVFIIIISVSALICGTVFIVARALALRKPAPNPEIAILRQERSETPLEQPPERLRSTAAPPIGSRARRRVSPAPGPGDARTVIPPHRTDGAAPLDAAVENQPGPAAKGENNKGRVRSFNKREQ